MYLGMNWCRHPSFRCRLLNRGKWHTRVPRGRPSYTSRISDLAKQRGTDTPKYSHQIKIETWMAFSLTMSNLLCVFGLGMWARSPRNPSIVWGRVSSCPSPRRTKTRYDQPGYTTCSSDYWRERGTCILCHLGWRTCFLKEYVSKYPFVTLMNCRWRPQRKYF